MKTLKPLFTVLFISFLIAGIGKISAQTAIETKDYFRGMPIHSIEASGPFHITLRSGTDTHVKLASKENQDISITCKSGKLKMSYKGNDAKNATILVTVYLPKVEKVSLEKGASLTTDETITGGSTSFKVRSNAQISDLQLNAKSASFDIKDASVKVNALNVSKAAISVVNGSLFEGSISQAKKTTLKADVGSRIDLKGACKNLSIKASAASNINCSDFAVKNADIYMEGASTANVNVSDQLEVELNTASSVKYRGTGVVKKEKLAPRATISKEE